ncbi:MAG: hypothetical protein FJW30_10425 [Acidobacteria bacterium]|nr:hypothetical protein [Acidobacteriota bacterium]
MKLAWLIWLAVATALTAPPLLWHVDLFKTHSPPAIAAVLNAVPVLLLAGLFIWHWLRRKLPAAAEPVALAALPLAVCLLRAPIPTGAGALLFLSAYGIGARIQAGSPGARIGLRFGFGAGVLILVLFAAGLAGWLNLWLGAALLAPALLARPLGKDLRELAGRWTSELHGPVESVSTYFALLFGGLGAIWTLTPAIAFDPLKMHLATARWYAETGVFAPLPTLAESYYPQGTELLMAMLWITGGGQAGAQMIAPIFLVATLVLLVALLRRLDMTRSAAVTGAAAALTIPFLHWTEFVAKNDAPLAFFLLACLYCVIDDRLPLATFFLAMAFGIKHVALFGAVALTPLFLWRIWRSPNRARALLSVGVIFLFLGTISLARTYILKGDPLYPESRARAADFSVVNHAYQSAGERVMRYAGIPWLLHFDGRRAFESTSHNPMGVWLVFFFPGLAAFIRGRNQAASLAILFVAIYLLYWVSILVTLRYALLPIALLVAWTAAGVTTHLPRRAAAAAAAYCYFFSLTVCVLIEVSAPQLFWLAGRSGTTEYLTAALPEYGSVAALYAKPAGRVFSLDNCASAYAPRVEDFQCLFMKDAANDPHRIASAAREGSYRYLILPSGERGKAVLEILQPSREVYLDRNFAVYDLVK